VPPDLARSARIDARVTPEQREKFERLGGPTWLRKMIDRAKEPEAANAANAANAYPCGLPGKVAAGN
jgi:hypothetical protein